MDACLMDGGAHKLFWLSYASKKKQLHHYHTLQIRKISKITESQMMNDKIQQNLVAVENHSFHRRDCLA